ncbi:MAG: hypothetical protein M1829_001416 [Trizodia sp. TS-e1964]|nr:MAG: hypothetical protein M1829_001416 [Trizodia sp. TS-e1964]
MCDQFRRTLGRADTNTRDRYDLRDRVQPKASYNKQDFDATSEYAPQLDACELGEFQSAQYDEARGAAERVPPAQDKASKLDAVPTSKRA